MIEKYHMTPLGRRAFVKLTGAGAAAFVATSLMPGLAAADANATAAAIKKLIGDKKTVPGKITLELPQIAENGRTVPVAAEVESPMTEQSHVTRLHLFAEKNPNPDVANFRFSPASGRARVATRIRLAKTQNIVAVAEMSDGTVHLSKSTVKVTIGGCGG